MKRSDLICENGVINDKNYNKFVHNFVLNRTECNEFYIDEYISGIVKKPVGRYITIFGGAEENSSECFRSILSEFIPDGHALVVGLGNERICSDSLGSKSIRFIPATAHLSSLEAFRELNMRKITVIEPGVTGKTGVESTEQIKCIADHINADFIIAVDSLACSETERLCRTIQITDAGICPGAGVDNSRKELSQHTTGRKVIAIGVPTVTDYENSEEKLMVTPRNIDIITDDYAKLIGKGISAVLNPGMTDNELAYLLVR